MELENSALSLDTINKMKECCDELHNILHTITHGGLSYGNPYSDVNVKKALKALAKYRGTANYLDAAD